MSRWKVPAWASRVVDLLGLPGVLIVVGTLLRIPQLFHSLNEMHLFRQAQTTLLARNYAEGSINLFHSPLPIFGRDSDVPLEFPLVQAAGAVLMRAGLPPETAMRLLGLVGFQLTAWLMFVLVRRWHGRRLALIALVLFQFSPFGFAWGASALIEFPAAAAALAMVVGLDSWFTDRKWGWLAIGVVGSWLAPLIKITSAVPWWLLVAISALVALRSLGWRNIGVRVAAGLAAGPGVGLALALAWTRYADSVKAQSPVTDFLTSDALMYWNFGTWEQRTSPLLYFRISDRVFQEILGPAAIALVFLIVVAVLNRAWPDKMPLRSGWLLVGVAGPLIFFPLYMHHNYYLVAVYAAWIVVTAFGVDFAATRLTEMAGPRSTPRRVLGATLALVLGGTAVTGLGVADLRQWAVDQGPPAPHMLLGAATGPDDAVITIGCNFSPAWTYYSRRPTLMLVPEHDVNRVWSATDIREYSYIFVCNPALDPVDYLPAGVTTAETDVPYLLRLVPDLS